MQRNLTLYQFVPPNIFDDSNVHFIITVEATTIDLIDTHIEEIRML